MTLSGTPTIQKELKVKEIFFLSLRLYKRNFLRFLAIFLLAEAVIVPINIFIQLFFPVQYPSPTATGFPFLDQLTSGFAAIPQSLVTVAILSPITSISDGMGVSLTAEMVEKEGSGLHTSYKTTIGSFRQIWYLALITGFVISLSDLFFAPLILFTILFFMALPAVIIEHKGALGGIVRSRRLLSKRWGQIFLLLLIEGAIVALPTLAIEQIISFPSPLGMIVFGIQGALVGPLYAIVSTIAFYSNATRLSNEERQKKEIETSKTYRLWICRNCKTSFASVSMPSPTAFGGCRAAKHGFFSEPRHEWVENPLLPSTNAEPR
ncbi:MAG TPA: hypothetical protein VGS11_10280 [Candidatus Bathyarchaeia archaeon]|nr:hypothetical protein [Candidatus Bathyarchaeia archaeon]